MEEQNSIQDWREEISTKTATLKILDGQLARVTFKDEGKKKVSADYGTSIAFLVRCDGENEDKTFYVKSNNFDLLGQIKELGKLVGVHAEISRKGSKKSDTRYSIKKI